MILTIILSLIMMAGLFLMLWGAVGFVQNRKLTDMYFAHPVIYEFDMKHEELLACHPKQWVKLMEEICK